MPRISLFLSGIPCIERVTQTLYKLLEAKGQINVLVMC